MVTHRLKGDGQRMKHTSVIMGHGAGLAMHDPSCPHDLTTKGFTNGLMPQTNPQNRNTTCKGFNSLNRNTRLTWSTWTRGDEKTIRVQTTDKLNVYLVISKHLHLLTKPTNGLDNIIGKRIVIIDDYNHDEAPINQFQQGSQHDADHEIYSMFPDIPSQDRNQPQHQLLPEPRDHHQS